MKNRKAAAAAAAVLAAVMMLSACGSQNSGSGTTSAGTTGAGTSAESSSAESGDGAVTRDEIILGGKADIKSTDPAGQSDVYSAMLVRHMDNGLLKLDEVGETVIGDLAESFDMPDDTTYHFAIRQGVKFHDGTELKASDVKFTLERAKEMASTKSTASYFDTVTVDGDYEVTLTLNQPCAAMLYLLTNSNMMIVSEKAVTEAGDQYVEQPVGTGPFKFVEWVPNDHWTIVRNDDYFGEKPITSKLTCRVIVEETSRVIALETGEIDMALDIAETEAANVEANPELVLEAGPSPSIEFLGLNFQNEYLSDKRVRQAIAYAIDKDVFIDAIVEGRGEVANSCIGKTVPGWSESVEAYPYDLEKAKELLAEAGYADGFDLEVIVSSEIRNRTAQLIQAQLLELGINVEISMYDFGAFQDMLADGDNDMFILGWSNSNVDPMRSTTPLFHGDYCGRNGNNYSFMQNDELDALMDEAASELDTEKRMDLYLQIQEMLKEEVPIVPLYYKQNINARRADLKGFVFNKATNHYYGNLHYEN